VLMDQKKFDEALKQLDAATDKEFAPLVADRRGDILLAQGKKDEAKAAYQKAWATMDAKVDYRRLVEAKLTALGAAPDADKKAAEGAK
jgi:predicted negative regulator of RcsB-dependent stress response